MPTRPPVIGGRTKKASWKPSSIKATPRTRGRAGQKDRKQVMAEEPVCRLCLKAGRTRASEQVDHIRPLAWGGSDDRTNKQALCIPCHEEKSRAERAVDAGQRRRY